ncbi:MAG: type 4a pilus biogenesis protein PilO [Oligoflexia bacterium]
MSLISLLRSLALPAVVLYSGWSYYQLHQFETAPDSDYSLKKGQLELAKKEIAILEKKNKEILDFVKALETKKVEVAGLSGKLLELRTTLTDRVDVPEFTRNVVTEAKRTGLTVLAIRPKPKADTEFYREFPFSLKFRGFYPQVVTFMGRIASMQRLVRLDQFKISPISSAAARFVELEGEVELKSFAYLASQADKVAEKPGGS